jgi:photosystem II stability/assembly factor-like uncharacterized protein
VAPRPPEVSHEVAASIPEDPAARRRRLFVTATVALLALLTGYLVWATSRRDPAPPAPPTLAPAVGAVALSPNHAWRWAAEAACERGSAEPRTTVERRDGPDGGTRAWVMTDVPLATVKHMSFAGDQYGVALGSDDRCLTALARTANGGRTWARVTGARPYAIDVSPEGAWRVDESGSGRTLQRAATADGPWTALADPCGDGDGDLSDVVAVSGKEAWVLCQGPAVGVRLLLHTRDRGTTWERRVDGREATGFGGEGFVRHLLLGAGTRGWAFVTGGERCPEGELRTTSDTALTWQPLPCVSTADRPVRTVLDVAIGQDGRGVLLGVSRGRRVVLETADGATTWRLAG